jgi:PAS domain S-box-containing protein/putative nucleotidyltransferase with HDIG domain
MKTAESTESEERLRLIFESVNDILILIDTEGRILEANSRIRDITGYGKEELIGKRIDTLGHIIERCSLNNVLDSFKKRIAGIQVPSYEVEIIRKDGRPVTVEISAVVVKKKGDIVGDLVIARDITVPKRAEAQLRQSETRYRLLAENVTDVIWAFYANSPGQLNYISPSVERLLGYSVEEAMAKRMDNVFESGSYKRAIDALREELDTKRSLLSGTSRSRTLELELYHKDGHLVPVEVNYSVISGLREQPAEILAVARDISNRRQAEGEIRRSTEKLIGAMEQTIEAMAMVVEMRDPYTAGHQRRVTQLACAIAKEMGIAEDRITGLRLAGLIHDIGKVRVPAEILTNPDGLSDAEFTMIKMHPTIGYEILKTIDFPWPVAKIVYQHHERLDGTGYPLGISREDIILEARVLAVADVVEAIASHRPYRPALGVDVALDEISKRRNRLYDSEVVNACLRLFRDKQFMFD